MTTSEKPPTGLSQKHFIFLIDLVRPINAMFASVCQRRREEVFASDEPDFDDVFAPSPTPPTPSTGAAVSFPKGEFLAVSELHTRDVENRRRATRELSRRRGEREGRSGWWIEKRLGGDLYPRV